MLTIKTAMMRHFDVTSNKFKIDKIYTSRNCAPKRITETA